MMDVLIDSGAGFLTGGLALSAAWGLFWLAISLVGLSRGTCGQRIIFMSLVGGCVPRLVTPTAGSIHMFGLDLSTHREEILQQVNFSSTYISMPQSLTVEENLWVVARLYGISDMARRINDIVKKLEMEEFRGKITRKLSSGQMTRLTLAKAFLTEPRILFLDEPTASLDPDIADKIRSLLKEERRSPDLSILYTSHNMREMDEMSDRIIFLQRGRIVAEGTAQEIIDRFGKADLEEVFLKFAREQGRSSS